MLDIEGPSSLFEMVKERVVALSFTTSKRHGFYQQLSMLLDVGISLHDALSAMREKYAHHQGIFKENWVEIAVLDTCLHRMQLGYNSLPDLLCGYIPQQDRLMLGQGNTRIVQSIDTILSLNKQFSALRKDIIKFSATPIVVVLMIIGMLYGCYYMLFPQLLSIFEPGQLPLVTRSLLWVTMFFVHFAPLIFLGLMVLFVGVALSFSRLTGHFRSIVDYLIPYSIYKRLQGIAFLLTLSALIEAKMPFDEAIEAISDNASTYLMSFIDVMSEQRAKGLSVGKALISASIFPQSMRAAIDIFDQAQRFKEGLFFLANKGLDQELSRIKTVFNIVSLIALFVGIGFGIWLYFSVGDISLSLQNSNILT